MEVAGPLGTPLGLAQRKRASPRGTSAHVALTRSRRESLAAKDAGRREERAAARTAGASQAAAGRSTPRASAAGSPLEPAPQGDPGRESPAGLLQDLLELPGHGTRAFDQRRAGGAKSSGRWAALRP